MVLTNSGQESIRRQRWPTAYSLLTTGAQAVPKLATFASATFAPPLGRLVSPGLPELFHHNVAARMKPVCVEAGAVHKIALRAELRAVLSLGVSNSPRASRASRSASVTPYPRNVVGLAVQAARYTAMPST